MWTAFFEDKTRIDRFLGGFLTHANTNKDAESHEFRIFKKVVDYFCFLWRSDYLFLQVVDGQLTTCFMWRTKDDLVNMAKGSLPLDFWRSDPTWKEGTPVFNADVDFSRSPDLGGFNPHGSRVFFTRELFQL